MDITITMVQDEIMDAIKDFMVKHDVVTAGKEVEISLIAGRGPAGHSAVIAIKGNTPGAIPTGPVIRTPTIATPVASTKTEPSPLGSDEPDPFANDVLPADSKAALRAKKTAAVAKKDVIEEVDALFAQENSMTEDLEEEVTETEDVLFGAE